MYSTLFALTCRMQSRVVERVPRSSSTWLAFCDFDKMQLLYALVQGPAVLVTSAPSCRPPSDLVDYAGRLEASRIRLTT
jgi:hypothetical protein